MTFYVFLSYTIFEFASEGVYKRSMNGTFNKTSMNERSNEREPLKRENTQY